MDCTGTGITTKSPLTPSHGDSLADQSFQSFKSKEIRDSESPTKDMKFTEQQLRSVGDGSCVVVPDTSGWNVVTSSEVKPDGTAFKTETLATTEGVRKIDGGQSQFAGKNEHVQQASHKGDDKNFVKTAAESSNTHLQESSVVGDEKSGRIEKKSSTVVSSSSQSFVSKKSGADDSADFDKFTDFTPDAITMNRRDSTQSNISTNSNLNSTQQKQLTLQEKLQQTRKNVESRSTTSVREEEHHEHYSQQEQKRYQEDVDQQQYRQIQQQQQQQQQQEQRNVREQQQNSAISKESERFLTKYTDKDGVTYTKSPVINQDSPAELQKQMEKLQAQPGKIISRTIEYPKPNLKMIVEKKELADGTIVTTRNYETKGATTATDNQQKVVSGTKITEQLGSFKTSITRNTNEEERQFSKNLDQRSKQILRDTTDSSRSTNINKTNTDDRETYEKDFQEGRQYYDRNQDTVDRAILNTSRQTASDHVQNLKDQVETFETHKTVKKDLSQNMRKENISSEDFIETERGCVMIDRNTGRPEKLISAPTDQYDDCYTETKRTSKNQSYNTITRESDNEPHGYPSTGPRQTPNIGRPQKPEEDFSTHGFPSQRSNENSREIYTTSERSEKFENRSENVQKIEDFSTNGFPSVRAPSPKKPFDHGPTKKSPKQPTDDFSTHGFPSARAPNVKTPVDHGYPAAKSPHDKIPTEDFSTHGFPSQRIDENTKETYVTSERTERFENRSENLRKSEDFSTHGFPSARAPTQKKPFDHGPAKKSPKQPTDDFSTHGFPSARAPNEKRPTDHGYPAARSPHEKTPKEDYGTNGFPSVREQPSTKRTDQVHHVDIKKTNQYETKSQQKTTEKRVESEVYASTESLRREKKTDAAHDAFARSLRCASPIDSPRRDSNASQKSTSYRTHSIQTSSRGSTPTYRAPTTTSKLKTREVHHSNETVDLGTAIHHQDDDMKRRGTTKVTTTTTTKTRDNTGLKGKVTGGKSSTYRTSSTSTSTTSMRRDSPCKN